MLNLSPFTAEKPMAGSTVNLDALIERDDFSSDAPNAGGRPRDTIGLSDLEANGFFQHSLRKPDFQRETTHWTPNAVYEIIRAFLDGDLIPAVILWERGNEYFVIDGAHRLSALMAWIRDDYGDGTASSSKFGIAITPEQKKIADRTRTLIRKEIGSYSEFKGLVGQKISDAQKSRWVSRIGGGAVDIQWVTAGTEKAAEDSFFKINQSAVPIDPTERRILQTRFSPSAIAARCIARGGRGHKYWKNFDERHRERIETLGHEINEILYKPPVAKQPVTTTDLPIAGQGYNAMPFVFELVCVSNNIPIPATQKSRVAANPEISDPGGDRTISFMANVKSLLELISTNNSGSLGLHPLVYCYSSSGHFQPNAFLATTKFALKLDREKKKADFTKVRRLFEQYLIANRQFVTLTMSRRGAGSRSLTRIVDLYWSILSDMLEGLTEEKIFERLVNKSEFKHLRQLDIPPPSSEFEPSKRGASSATKSVSFISLAMATPTPCAVCGAAIHANSVTFDHRIRRNDGGDNRSENLSPAHPFCYSGIKA